MSQDFSLQYTVKYLYFQVNGVFNNSLGEPDPNLMGGRYYKLSDIPDFDTDVANSVQKHVVTMPGGMSYIPSVGQTLLCFQRSNDVDYKVDLYNIYETGSNIVFPEGSLVIKLNPELKVSYLAFMDESFAVRREVYVGLKNNMIFDGIVITQNVKRVLVFDGQVNKFPDLMVLLQ